MGRTTHLQWGGTVITCTYTCHIDEGCKKRDNVKYERPRGRDHLSKKGGDKGYQSSKILRLNVPLSYTHLMKIGKIKEKLKVQTPHRSSAGSGTGK